MDEVREPEVDDIKYVIDQLIQVRGEALEKSEISSVLALFSLTDNIQALIDYLTDYFGLERR